MHVQTNSRCASQHLARANKAMLIIVVLPSVLVIVRTHRVLHMDVRNQVVVLHSSEFVVTKHVQDLEEMRC